MRFVFICLTGIGCSWYFAQYANIRHFWSGNELSFVPLKMECSCFCKSPQWFPFLFSRFQMFMYMLCENTFSGSIMLQIRIVWVFWCTSLIPWSSHIFGFVMIIFLAFAASEREVTYCFTFSTRLTQVPKRNLQFTCLIHYRSNRWPWR